MMTLTLKTTGDTYWDRVAALLNDEVGAVSGEFVTDGATYFNAVFSLYGGEFSWIPAAVCTVTAVADLAQ